MAAAVLVTALATWLLRRLRGAIERTTARFVEAVQQRNGLRVRSVQLASAEALTRVLRSTADAVRLAASLALLYLWLLATTLALDPSRRILSIVLAPLRRAVTSLGSAVLGFLPNAVMLALIYAVARMGTRLIDVFTEAAEQGRLKLGNLDADLARPTRRLLKLGVWLFAAVMAVPYLPGSDSKAFAGISIFVGVLVSLGSSSLISNVFAGLVLTYSRAYREGERVRIGETEGEVVSLGVLATRLRTIHDEEVTVPNAVAQATLVTNFSRYAAQGGVQVHVQVTISYETPWRAVHELLIGAAQATEGVLPHPEPYVLQRALDDFYVRYEICAYTDRASDLHRVESRLCQAILDAFDAAGVDLCSPHFESVRDGRPSGSRGAPLPGRHSTVIVGAPGAGRGAAPRGGPTTR